jgi:hypothetical protein
VFESWEGTHNVLCAQVLRDLAKLDAIALVLERVGPDQPPDLEQRLRRSVADDRFGALHFRRQLNTVVRALQVTCLRAEGNDPPAELHARRHLTPGYDPQDDPGYADLIDRVLTWEPK